MGKVIEFFSSLPRFLEIVFTKPQFWLATLLIVGAVTFVSVSKSQKAQQRAMVRKVKAVKAKQFAYNKEKDLSKIAQREKKYNKAVKALRSRIRYALCWNKKKIVLTSPYLLDTSEKANLALSGKKSFNFKDVLNEELEAKNKKRKQKTQIVEQNNVMNELVVESKQENKVAKKETKLETPVVEVRTLQPKAKEISPVIVKEKVNDDNMSSIYKTKKDNEYIN
ncbi:MAG: hypothetical protein ACI4TI_00495 [Christensenellales bacterium]